MPSDPKGKTTGGKTPATWPISRNSERSEEWIKFIGPSLNAIPSNKLPLVRTILQRYRALRITSPSEKDLELAKQIAEEVKSTWDRARIPTTEPRNQLYH